MENFNIFKSSGNLGHILITRRLLNALIDPDEDILYVRMYAYCLSRAAYGNGISGENGLERGELFFSTRRLSERFNINRRTLMRMLNKMSEEGLIQIINSKVRGKSSRIKMLYYDQMCDFATVYGETSYRTKRQFEMFWDLYIEASGKEPVDKELALSHWKRLDDDECLMALASMSIYFDTIPRSRCDKAVECWAKKSFLVSVS